MRRHCFPRQREPYSLVVFLFLCLSFWIYCICFWISLCYTLSHIIFLCFISHSLKRKQKERKFGQISTRKFNTHPIIDTKPPSLFISSINKKNWICCCILVSGWMIDWWLFSGSVIWFLIGCLQHSCFPFSFCSFPMRMIFLSYFVCVCFYIALCRNYDLTVFDPTFFHATSDDDDEFWFLFSFFFSSSFSMSDIYLVRFWRFSYTKRSSLSNSIVRWEILESKNILFDIMIMTYFYFFFFVGLKWTLSSTCRFRC